MEKHGANVNLAWSTWVFKVKSVIINHVPRSEVKHRSSPWLDGECLHLIHLKKEAWRKAKRTNSDLDWANCKTISNQSKQMINNKYQEFVQAAFEDLNDNLKQFWKLVGIKNKSTSSLPHEMT